MKLRNKNLLLLITPIIALVLEILPYGAVLNFSNGPEADLIRKTYSYFDLIPFGYANIGPLFTSVLTCIIIGTSLVLIITNTQKLLKPMIILSALSLVTSLMPLIYGVNYISLIGMFISILLFLELVLSVVIFKKSNFNSDKI